MRFVLSGRVVGLVLVVVLLATVLNTCLVINVYTALNDVGQTDSSGFEFVVSGVGSSFQVRDTLTKQVVSGFASAAIAINYALSQGNSVFLKGTFDLTADIVVSNKWNAKLVGDNGALINANGYRIVVCGDNYTLSKYPLVSGLILNNGTLRVENTFGATITNMQFQNSMVGLEFVNSDTWTEGSKIENCHFINCTEGIAFRTPTGTATGSYESTEITRCFFNQYDHSIAINLETNTELSCSNLQNLRIWIGEYDNNTNQTGLRIAGTMSQTLLTGVVFESFSNTPNLLFGIDLLESTNAAPILNTNVSFLGNFTAKIHNPNSIWIPSTGSLFKQENQQIPIGLNGQYQNNLTITPTPLKITNFKPKIDVQGTFTHNETITVRIQIEYIDNTYTTLKKTYTTNTTQWLTDDELLTLYTSQNMATAIIIDATCNTNSTDATLIVSGYGTAG
jgi:hypothetical protein